MTRRLEPIEVVRAACGVVRSPGVGPAESATHGRWRPTYEKGVIMSRERPGVGVEMTIARNPLHGSGRAALPHPALASGDDAKSPQGIGMTYARRGQPPLDE